MISFFGEISRFVVAGASSIKTTASILSRATIGIAWVAFLQATFEYLAAAAVIGRNARRRIWLILVAFVLHDLSKIMGSSNSSELKSSNLQL